MIALLVFGTISFAATACSEVGGQAMVKAMGTTIGDTESHVREVAGPPTRIGEPSPDCAGKGGAHALVYESGVKRFGAYDPVSWAVLCVDASHVVIDVHMVST